MVTDFAEEEIRKQTTAEKVFSLFLIKVDACDFFFLLGRTIQCVQCWGPGNESIAADGLVFTLTQFLNSPCPFANVIVWHLVEFLQWRFSFIVLNWHKMSAKQAAIRIIYLLKQLLKAAKVSMGKVYQAQYSKFWVVWSQLNLSLYSKKCVTEFRNLHVSSNIASCLKLGCGCGYLSLC